MIGTLRQVLRFIDRGQRSKWIMLIVLAVVASGFEMAGAVMVFILIGLVSDAGADIDLPLIGDVRSLVGDVDQDSLLLGTVIATAIFFLLRGFVQVGTIYAQSRVANNAGAQLSNTLARGYLYMPYPNHLARNSSELVRNSYQAVQLLVSQVFLPLINIAASAILTVGMLTVMVAITPAATGVAIVVIGASAAIVLSVVLPRIKRVGATAHDMQRETLNWLQQSLHGIRDIRILGRERYFAHRYGKSRLRLARSNYQRAALSQLPSTIIEFSLIGFILLFFALTILGGDEAQQALPVLGLFAYVGLRLQPSIQRMINGINSIKFATAPIEDLYADLQLLRASEAPTIPTEGLPFKRSLELRDVGFAYEGTERPALSGIDLVIRPGEEIGLCGPTGGGKTTLTDIIAGLLSPTNGSILVDGVDLLGNESAWHRNLGVVPQMVFLTDDTLRRNIALGIPDAKIDDDAVREAVGLAQLSDFVDGLPEGLETTVGERGVRISGGQRQRIAIARALYRRPNVLIFDEGTSALDQETEAKLMASIERLRGSHTIILVAHRLSTVQNSDRVIFVEGGRVSGVGSFSELQQTNESFRRMSTSQ